MSVLLGLGTKTLRSSYVSQVGLQLKILLSQAPVCQTYMHAATLEAYHGCLAARSTKFEHAFIGKCAWALAHTCRYMPRPGSRRKQQAGTGSGRKSSHMVTILIPAAQKVEEVVVVID